MGTRIRGFLLSRMSCLQYPSPRKRVCCFSRKDSGMKFVRKLVIGCLAATGVLACLVGTMLASKLYRHLTWYESQKRHYAEREDFGPSFDRAFPRNPADLPAPARI